MEETAVATLESVQQETGSPILVARNQMEMQRANQALASWVHQKLKVLKSDKKELEGELGIAQRNKWRTTSFKRLIVQAANQITYYGKIVKAVEAGYAVIPDMQMTVFAVRTDDSEPAPNQSRWKDQNVVFAYQLHAKLPEGEGEYVGTEADRNYSFSYEKDGKRIVMYKNTDFRAIAFPLIAAKQTLMNVASEAMQLKVFDEIGVAPPHGRAKDPVLIGTVRGPKGTCNFILAWFLDLRRL